MASTGLLIKSEIQNKKDFIYKLHLIYFNAIDIKKFIHIKIIVPHDLLVTHSTYFNLWELKIVSSTYVCLYLHTQGALKGVLYQVARVFIVGVKWL